MGMRFGVIAATATQADLLAELNRHAGEFELDYELDSPFDAVDEGRTGWELGIGERAGKSFVVDGALTLSNSPDMLVAMSGRLGLAVAGGADTMFGWFWFTAAKDGDLLRFVDVDPESTSRELTIGDPLLSEAEHPVGGDFHGAGVFAAMAALGLDPRPWLDSGPAWLLNPVGERYPEDGDIARVRSEHVKRYPQADDEWPDEVMVIPPG